MSQMTEGPICSSMHLSVRTDRFRVVHVYMSIDIVFSESTTVDKGKHVNLAGVKKA